MRYFPCNSFRNIISETLKNVRVSISSSALLFSGLFLAHGKHSLSVKTQFLCRELSNLNCRVLLRSLILSIYRFKRDDFLSENGIFGFTQYGHNMAFFPDLRQERYSLETYSLSSSSSYLLKLPPIFSLGASS